MAGMTLAQVVVDRGGYRKLMHCVDLLVLWSVATKGGEDVLSVAEVQEYGARNSWGSEAKFYRLLKEWRSVLPEADSPGVVLQHVKLSKKRREAMLQALMVPAAVVPGLR